MALYFKKKLDDEATIAVWKVTETEEELRNLLGDAPDDEMEEISYIKSESLRCQKLAVRALLNEIFGEEEVFLSHHDNGKPYLENLITNISITHTAKYVAVILHDEEDVGIDLESLDRDFSAVEKKALSDDEVDDLDEGRKNEQLALYWCAKEAIYKRVSVYGLDFSEQIEVDHFRPKDEGELSATYTNKDGYEEHFTLEYTTFDGHVMVWVVGNDD